MDKIILTKDITLNKLDTDSGRSGEIIIEQDNTGGHIASISSSDKGFVDLSLIPKGITLVKWYVDDVTTYWSSEKMTSDEAINPPSLITDLSLEIVDTISAKINWTAPEGFAGNPNSKADLYFIVLSSSPLVSGANYTGVKLALQPLNAGIAETYIIPGLESGKRYYAAIYAQRSAFGATRTSAISNSVTFVTTALEGNITVPKRIPLNAEKIYEPLIKVKFEDGEQQTNYPSFKRLGEVQNFFVDNGGIPSGLPPYSKVACCWSYGTWDLSWYNIGGFYKVYFELDGIYNLDYIYCLFGTNNRFKIFTSSDGLNLTEAYDRDVNPFNMYDGWTRIPIADVAKNGVKYIVLGVFGGETWYNGFVPYGTKQTANSIVGKKFKNPVTPKPLAKVIGTNAFAAEQQMDWVGQTANFLRLYTNSDWVMSGIYRNKGVASTDPNAIQMNSKLSHVWDWEAKFQLMRNAGIENICITLVSSFAYLRDTTDTNDYSNTKPVNKGLNYSDLSVTTNPMSYTHVARIWGALAYRWGSNPNAPDVYNQFVENDGLKGLGYVTALEPGNELDRHWGGQNAFMNPEEMAAYLSAIWDGHKGAMGVGYGIKGADPNMELMMPGMFFINSDYVVIMKLWWDMHRGKGDYPIKRLNFHHYNTYSEITDLPKYPPLYVDAYALMPEYGSLLHETERLNKLRSLEMQGCGIAVTEMGYDETYMGIYAFLKQQPIDRAILKAAGIMRSYMIYNKLGLDVVCQYVYGQTAQDNEFKLANLGPQQIMRPKFTSSMLVEGVEYSNSFNRERLPVFWYIAAFKNELGDYYYTHSVMEAGELLISEPDIVVDYSPTTWIFAYQSLLTGQKMLIIWNAVDDFTTYVAKLKVNNSDDVIQTVNFSNQYQRGSINGQLTNVLPVLNAGTKTVSTIISAVPLIVKTQLVGTPKLIVPKDIQTETINATSIKITWLDENIGTNKARIYMSTDPTTNFAIVEEVYRDNAETTITTLNPNTAYYFRVQFVDGTKLSDVSSTISSRTGKNLVTPTNLTQDIATSSTITLVWSYPTLEELNATDFIIYRSTSLNGVYSEVARIPIASRLYRDFGLISSTPYFYKIKAYGDGSYSAFSFALAGTTSAPSYIPPTIQSMTTNATGDRIELYFDEDLKDEQTAINAFSIMEKYGSKVIYHPVTSISIPSNNLSKVILGFDIPIFKNSSITVSYSASLGALKSLYNFAVNTFSNYLVMTNAVAILYTPVVDYNSLYNISVNGNNLTGTGSGNAVSKVKIAAGTTAILQWNVDISNGMIVGLDQTVDPEGNSGMDFYTRKYIGKQEWKKGSTSGLSTQTLNKGLMRFRTDGTTIYYEHSTDSGTSWITVQTAVQPNIDLYIKMYCEASGQQLNNIVGINLVGSTQIVVPAPPTNMVIDDVLNTVSFTPNPGYVLGEHEYCTNYSSFTQNWLIVPSNPISVGDVNIPLGDFAIRVREATDRAASTAIVSTVDITGSINSSSAIMVQKSNGGAVVFGCTTLAELNTYLSTANITQNITVQFNTSSTYLLTTEYNPFYTNNTNWVTFQGAAGVRPVFDAQQIQGTVWNIRSYTILRNLEIRNANLEAAGATLIRADQRHHCKFFDLIFDTGFCCIRATDGGMPGLGIYEFEVDNIIVRNVWGGSFRINGETTNPNCNMSFKNVMLDNPTCDTEGKGSLLPNSTRQFSGGLVLKQQNGLVVENFRSMSGDLLFDMGEIENCNNVVVKNIRGRSILLLGSLAGNQYSNFQQTGKNFKLYNCYFPDVSSYMNELDGLDMIHCQFKLFIYQCKNFGKFRGNIFKEGLNGFLMSPADMPVLESDNIMIANSVNGRYVNWNFPSAPDFYVDESNKANYKLTQGLNSIFVPYANRGTLNQNPNGSLRLNSIGKGAITTVIEGTDVDVYNVNRVYPTDIGPYSGLQPDQNDQPLPPTVTGDNLTRALIFSHPLGATEIVFSTNGGPFVQYTGAITVADTPITANYYLAKVKAASYRNESAVVGSPEFTAKPVDNSYQVLRTVEIDFKSTGGATPTEPNVNLYQTNSSGSSTGTSLVVPLIDITGAAFGTAMNYQKGFSGTTTDACPTGLAYIRSEQCFTSALEINDAANATKVKFTGLDPTKFYQFYVMSCSQYSNNKVRITMGSNYKDWIVSLNYPLAANGDIHSNPAVARFNDNVPDANGELIIEFLKDAQSSWQHVAVNYIVIEETNKAKPA